jgi:hypothetical protein
MGYGKQNIRLEEREMPHPQARQVLIKFGYGGMTVPERSESI